MERRKAITTAAAASLTLLAGAAGIALNSGIVGAGGDDKVGQISPVATTASPPVTIYVDDPSAANPVARTPIVRPTDGQPVTASAASAVQSGDDDDEHENREHEEDEAHEYEGADDDD